MRASALVEAAISRRGRATRAPVVLCWFAASRLVALGCFLALYLIGPTGLLGPKFYETPLRLLGVWDGTWYLRVAAHGYLLIPGHQSDPAFFPLFPILVRAVHASGLSLLASAVLIANAAFAVAVVAFLRLGRRLLPEEIATRGAVYLAVAPMGFVYSMAYPESLLVALVSLAAVAALDDRWLAAAILAALAVLTRPEGLLLTVVPLGALAWQRRRALDADARGRAVAAVLAGPTALLAFVLYLQWALGDGLAWSKAEQPWGRVFRLDGPFLAAEHLPRLLDTQPFLTRDLVLLLLDAVLLVVAARRTSLPRAWILAGALVLALPLFSGTIESEGRFGLLALPVYWGAASLRLPRRAEQAVRAGSLVLVAGCVLTIPYIWP